MRVLEQRYEALSQIYTHSNKIFILILLPNNTQVFIRIPKLYFCFHKIKQEYNDKIAYIKRKAQNKYSSILTKQSKFILKG